MGYFLFAFVTGRSTMKVMAKATKRDTKGLFLDSWDRKNIAAAIDLYTKVNPPGKVRYEDVTDEHGKTVRWIEYCNIDDYLANRRREMVALRNKYKSSKGISDEVAHISMSMPPALWAVLQRGYPALLTDRYQQEQFLKWFPQFSMTKE